MGIEPLLRYGEPCGQQYRQSQSVWWRRRYMDMPGASDGESTTNRPIKKSTDGAYDDMPADDHGYMDMGEGGYSDVVGGSSPSPALDSGYMDVGESSPSPALESGYMDVGEHGGDNGIYDDAVGEDDMYAGF